MQQTQHRSARPARRPYERARLASCKHCVTTCSDFCLTATDRGIRHSRNAAGVVPGIHIGPCALRVTSTQQKRLQVTYSGSHRCVGIQSDHNALLKFIKHNAHLARVLQRCADRPRDGFGYKKSGYQQSLSPWLRCISTATPMHLRSSTRSFTQKD